MSGPAVRDVTDDFMVEDAAPAGGPRRQPAQRESDPRRLAQRQKQIDMGKNTLGYQRYCEAVPRQLRNGKTDPITPDIYQMCSKRAFEGQVKKWRRQLHAWDPPEDAEPALLPVHADSGGAPASNPPPPREPSDDFEHITHAEAAGNDAGAPKNGGALRLGESQGLPLKIPSAMRKRAFDETMAAADADENLQPQQNQQARPAAPGAKVQRRSLEAEERPKTASGNAASAPSWADQRSLDPELDYGVSDDEDGWQHVQQPNQYKMIHNNALAQGWDEEEVQI